MSKSLAPLVAAEIKVVHEHDIALVGAIDNGHITFI
jgi:hypothetical protein